MKIRCVTALVIAAAGPLAGQAPVPWTLSGSPSLFVARQQIATSDQLSGALLAKAMLTRVRFERCRLSGVYAAEMKATRDGGRSRLEIRLSPKEGEWLPLELGVTTGPEKDPLQVSWFTKEDSRPRPLPPTTRSEAPVPSCSDWSPNPERFPCHRTRRLV